MRAFKLPKRKNAVRTSSRREQRSERDDERDQHPGADRDDRRRVFGAQTEQRQPLPTDLMTDPVPDVGDRAGDDDDQHYPEDAADITPPTPSASNHNPIKLNSTFGVQAAIPASHWTPPRLRQTVAMT